MRLTTLLVVTGAAAAAYAGARRLMGPVSNLERLPPPARAPLEATRSRLLSARARVAEALREAETERDRAQRDLTREYRERSGHS